MTLFEPKKMIILAASAIMLISIIIGCANSTIETTREDTVTETLDVSSSQTLPSEGIVFVEDEDGNTSLLYGDIIEEATGEIFIEDRASGRRIKITREDIVPDSDERVKTTVRKEDGTTTEVVGPTVKKTDRTTSVIDPKTGKEYTLDDPEETTAAPTPKPTTQSTTTAKPTAAPTPKPTTQSTTTAKPTTAPTPKPTTQLTTTAKPTTAPTTTVAPTTKEPQPTWPVRDVPKLRQEMFDATNDVRTAAGLPPLAKGSAALQEIAMIRAEELATLYGHKRPDGTYYDDMLREYGISSGCDAENIARFSEISTVQCVITAWSNSSGHYRQIVRPEHDSVAIGYYQCQYGRQYWVQVFIGEDSWLEM